MAKCRERLVEFDYVVWDGKAETAIVFLGHGGWRHIDISGHALYIDDRAPIQAGDVILKDPSGNVFVMKPLDFALAYETIEECMQ